MSGTLNITRDCDRYAVALSGRANFETVVPLRDFIKTNTGRIAELSIDLGECRSMDSTCMGVLSMLALFARRQKAVMTIFNAGNNRLLLKGLGVEKLFTFTDAVFSALPEQLYPPPEPETAADAVDTTETVIDAHRTLIAADDANQEKFDAVVKFAEQDLKRLKQ